jgi:hypothetical protein
MGEFGAKPTNERLQRAQRRQLDSIPAQVLDRRIQQIVRARPSLVEGDQLTQERMLRGCTAAFNPEIATSWLGFGTGMRG